LDPKGPVKPLKKEFENNFSVSRDTSEIIVQTPMIKPHRDIKHVASLRLYRRFSANSIQT